MKTIAGVDVLDSIEELVDPAHTAVLVVDVQNDFCHPNGHFARYGKDLTTTREMLPRAVHFVKRARELGVRIVYLRQITLPHGLSDSPAWLRFKCRDGKSPEYTLKGSWGADFVDGLEPADGEVVVEKFRPDGFHYTPLDRLLRATGIRSLVIFGTTTEGCVESTVRGASYHDYYVVVPNDLLSSPNQTLHEGSLRLFEARYPMKTSGELIDVWETAKVAARA